MWSSYNLRLSEAMLCRTSERHGIQCHGKCGANSKCFRYCEQGANKPKTDEKYSEPASRFFKVLTSTPFVPGLNLRRIHFSVLIATGILLSSVAGIKSGKVSEGHYPLGTNSQNGPIVPDSIKQISLAPKFPHDDDNPGGQDSSSDNGSHTRSQFADDGGNGDGHTDPQSPNHQSPHHLRATLNGQTINIDLDELSSLVKDEDLIQKLKAALRNAEVRSTRRTHPSHGQELSESHQNGMNHQANPTHNSEGHNEKSQNNGNSNRVNTSTSNDYVAIDPMHLLIRRTLGQLVTPPEDTKHCLSELEQILRELPLTCDNNLCRNAFTNSKSCPYVRVTSLDTQSSTGGRGLKLGLATECGNEHFISEEIQRLLRRPNAAVQRQLHANLNTGLPFVEKSNLSLLGQCIASAPQCRTVETNMRVALKENAAFDMDSFLVLNKNEEEQTLELNRISVHHIGTVDIPGLASTPSESPNNNQKRGRSPQSQPLLDNDEGSLFDSDLPANEWMSRDRLNLNDLTSLVSQGSSAATNA